MKTLKVLVINFIVLLMLFMSICSCDEDNKPVYHWKVYRENFDGTHTLWTMTEKPTIDEGFVSWKRADGTNLIISGKISIESYRVGVE